ncbi:hypothetical protein R1sor_022238 [Riccia sorocarpa]|uniref:DUF1475 domain-containing protein n=1 Tax=Riccia sorocarpa TaxID=122646 RepID=A0ABD3GM90_9MARC
MANPVLVGRALCPALAFAQLSVLFYTLLTAGSPLRKAIYTPWMNATLVDFYITTCLFIGWIWYKEQTWTKRLVWAYLVLCTGSVAGCSYLAIEFFKLSPDDPPHLVLLKDRHTR